MRRRFLSSCAGIAVLVVLTAAPVAAKVSDSGTPGAPNCVGQTTAFVNQGGLGSDTHGLAAAARWLGYFPESGITSVQDLHAAIVGLCAVP